MKNFITSMLGTLAAMIIFAAGGLFLFLLIMGALVAASGKKTQSFQPGSFLVLDLSTNITDSPPRLDLGDLSDRHPETLQLRTVTHALRSAAFDNRIKGVLLIGSLSPSGYGSGYAALAEVRAALKIVEGQKKPVLAYLDFASSRDYYLASAADTVILNPYGLIAMPGLASEPVFFAGAFEKYGIGVQVTRVGKYKSFVEPYIRKDMSPENRQQTQELLNDLWGTLLKDIAADRKLTPKSIQATVDTEGIIRPEAAQKAGLVDKIEYRDELIEQLKGQTNVTGPQSFRQVSLEQYAKLVAPSGHFQMGGNRIAVVYAEGEIVDGEGTSGEIGGTRFARHLRELREDDSIKAVVLRVNSPGGSASAAEAIQREIRLTQEVKPVVVSMGSYAASGGYWISAYSDRIFAEPATITGSIGVFGILFDIQKLAGNFGVTFDGVKTAKYADTLSISRPKTEEEMALIQKGVDWIYAQFVAKVAEGRKLKPEFVQDIAQGRVWSGTEAKRLGLVDELGGLDAALRYTATKVGIAGNYRISEFPPTKTLSEELAELFGKVGPEGLNLHSEGITEQIAKRIDAEFGQLRAFNDPQGIYARMPMDLSIR